MPIKILNARVINGNPVKFYQTRKDLKLVLPAAQRTEIATTIELTLSKSAEAAGIIRPFSTTGSLAYNKKVTASSSVGQFLHDAAAAVDDNPNTFWTLGRKSYTNCDKYFGSKLHYVRSRQELRNIFCTSG
jgi:alpha-L-fucosidase